MYIVEPYKRSRLGNDTVLILRDKNATYGPVIIPWNHLCPSQRTTFNECVKLIEDALFSYFDKNLGVKDAKSFIDGIMRKPLVSVYQKSGYDFSKNKKFTESVSGLESKLNPDKILEAVSSKFNVSVSDLRVQYYFSIPDNVDSIIPHFYIKHYAGQGSNAKYVVQFFGMREINSFVQANFPKSFFDNSVSEMIDVNLGFGNEVYVNDEFIDLLRKQKEHNDLLKAFRALNFSIESEKREKLIDEMVLEPGSNSSDVKISFLKKKLKNHFSGIEDKLMEDVKRFNLPVPELNPYSAIPFLFSQQNNEFSYFNSLPESYSKEKLSDLISIPSYLIDMKLKLKSLSKDVDDSAKRVDEESEVFFDNVLYIRFSTNKVIRGKFR